MLGIVWQCNFDLFIKSKYLNGGTDSHSVERRYIYNLICLPRTSNVRNIGYNIMDDVPLYVIFEGGVFGP